MNELERARILRCFADAMLIRTTLRHPGNNQLNTLVCPACFGSTHAKGAFCVRCLEMVVDEMRVRASELCAPKVLQ